MKTAKSIAESEIVLSEVMMPMYANHYGSVHGGIILRLVDEAAFVAATKHARKNVVLASIQMVFKQPVNIGDMLNIKARLCYVGHSSMDIEVEIDADKLKEGKTIHVGRAYLTMVALDESHKPTEVPRLILRTKREKLKAKIALARRKK